MIASITKACLFGLLLTSATTWASQGTCQATINALLHDTVAGTTSGGQGQLCKLLTYGGSCSSTTGFLINQCSALGGIEVVTTQGPSGATNYVTVNGTPISHCDVPS